MNDTILQGLLKNSSIRFAAIAGRELVTEAQRIHSLSRTATAADRYSRRGTAESLSFRRRRKQACGKTSRYG